MADGPNWLPLPYVSSSSSWVNGKLRVRWWKQLSSVNLVTCADGIVPLATELITCVVVFNLLCECSGFESLGDDVNEAVVVMGNENALWCDTVNSFDARTEKLFAATVKTKKRKK